MSEIKVKEVAQREVARQIETSKSNFVVVRVASYRSGSTRWPAPRVYFDQSWEGFDQADLVLLQKTITELFAEYKKRFPSEVS